MPLPAKQILWLWTRGSGSRKESAAGRGVEMNAKQAGLVQGKGWNFASYLRDTHARSLLQTAVRSSFACQPGQFAEGSLLFFLPCSHFPGLFPHWLRQGGSAVGKVAKAEQKQLILIADVLTAVCKMSLSTLPPAWEGWLANMRGAGYRKC